MIKVLSRNLLVESSGRSLQSPMLFLKTRHTSKMTTRYTPLESPTSRQVNDEAIGKMSRHFTLTLV